jgi:type IX secretion system PorP/SprF family membrane protein
VGLIIVNNQQGLQRNTEASLQFNYRLSQKKFVLAVGAQGGVMQASLDGSKIITPQGTYETGTVQHNDPILTETLVNSLKPVFGAGVALQSRRVKAGVSALYLNEPKLSLTQGSSAPSLQRNFFSYLTYNFNLSRNVKAVPSAFVKYDLVDMQHEANVSFEHRRLGLVGVGYRGFTSSNRDAAYAFLGFRLSKKWRVAYAYDYTLSALGNGSYGSHELLLRYESVLTGVAKPGKIIYTPRF